MIPLIPIVGWALGGLFGAAAIAAACDDDADCSFDEEASERAAREAAANEKARLEREASERRKKARLDEAERSLSRIEERHQRRISSAKSNAARSKAELDGLAAIDHDLDNLFK